MKELIKLHVGCGKRNFGQDWIHIDGGSFTHVTDHDVTLSGYENASVDLIYSCHLLSYFDRSEAELLLLLWNKKIVPGGVLRIAVPDFENMYLAVRYNGFTLDDILGPLYGKMRMNEEIIYHKTCYDYFSLKALLEKTGFKNVRRYDWRKTEHVMFDDHSRAHLPHDPEAIKTGEFTDKHIPISLNLEATK